MLRLTWRPPWSISGWSSRRWWAAAGRRERRGSRRRWRPGRTHTAGWSGTGTPGWWGCAGRWCWCLRRTCWGCCRAESSQTACRDTKRCINTQTTIFLFNYNSHFISKPFICPDCFYDILNPLYRNHISEISTWQYLWIFSDVVVE